MEISQQFIHFRDIIYHFHMPLFFFLSGLFVQGSLFTRGIKKFIVNKFCLIAYPYFVWSILNGGILVLVSNYTYLNFTISDLSNIWYRPLQHFWFLYSLLFMFVVYAVLIEIVRVPLAVIALSSVFIYISPITSQVATMNYFSANFIFFIIGIIYNKYYHLDIIIDSNVYLSIIIAIGFLAFSKVIGHIDATKIAEILRAISGIIAVLLISKYLAQKDYLPTLKTVGIYSMPIYLVHGLAGSGTRIILHNFFRFQNTIVIIVASWIVGVAIPLLIYKLHFPYLFELEKTKE